MQVSDADFYPVCEKKKTGNLIRALVILLCAALLTVLGIRVFTWTQKRQETELLALTNPWNSVASAEFTPKLIDIGGGMQADKRCAAQLEKMLSDCAAAGNSPQVYAAYRSAEAQQSLYDERLQELLDKGSSPEEAEAQATQELAKPGYSEHELGLAVDIVDAACQKLDLSLVDTETCKWLMENCWSYGFILRYPEGKTDVTGFMYEPWHYRYVGVTAAEQMQQLDLTFEEYMAMFYSEQAVVVYED